MKILFVATSRPDRQGDLLEISILHGLRTILGDNCIEYPRKKIMYHDFSDTPRHTLHGRGFSLLTYPLQEIKRSNIFDEKFDIIIYGDGHIYGESACIPELNRLANNNYWILDGHDLYGDAPRKIIWDGEVVIGAQFMRSFKRELVENLECVYPTGFGIPIERIMPINLLIKDQLYQKTAPCDTLFEPVRDMGGGYAHHKFTSEDEYYHDLSRSWFGLTCKKGGWDCLRHYEIIAAGTLLLFKDYLRKPYQCSPQNLPCFSYSDKCELNELMTRLVINNKPTQEYLDMLISQRQWLYTHGTTVARANSLLKIVFENSV